MTEEEKKAIEMLKDRRKDLLEGGKSSFYSSDRELYKEHAEAIDTIFNLIEKLKKENEEYKLLNANIEKANRIIEGKEKYISKDKIREKIKELQEKNKNTEEIEAVFNIKQMQILEELLTED